MGSNFGPFCPRWSILFPFAPDRCFIQSNLPKVKLDARLTQRQKGKFIKMANISTKEISLPQGQGSVKADLHGTIFAYDCRMRFLWRALLVSWTNRIRFPPISNCLSLSCRRVLKHVSNLLERIVCTHMKSLTIIYIWCLHWCLIFLLVGTAILQDLSCQSI